MSTAWGSDNDPPFRDLRNIVDEDHAPALKVLHHVPVVYDLVKHIDRRPLLRQHLVHDIDRHVDAGTETSRIG